MDGEWNGDRLVASFERWAASERVAESAAGRARATWLARQSAASATWRGVLLDLAERAAPVGIAMVDTQLHGRLVGVGRDFCVLETPTRKIAVIAVGAIASLAPVEGPTWPGGDRSPSLDLGLVSIMEALMEDRAPVVVHTAGPAPVDGELMAIAEDFLTIRRNGQPRRPVHVPLSAITYCELR